MIAFTFGVDHLRYVARRRDGARCLACGAPPVSDEIDPGPMRRDEVYAPLCSTCDSKPPLVVFNKLRAKLAEVLPGVDPATIAMLPLKRAS